jgi:hypothetical protein
MYSIAATRASSAATRASMAATRPSSLNFLRVTHRILRVTHRSLQRVALGPHRLMSWPREGHDLRLLDTGPTITEDFLALHVAVEVTAE